MLLLEQARGDVVRTCRELAATGLVVGTSGNVSVRVGDLVAVSPSGVDYAELAADLVGVHRLDGTAVEAPLQPTSEMPLHLGVYAATSAAAVVHTHPVAATALSTLVDELPAIHYQVAMFGGPVAVAPYAT
jgi:L-fuculose-phosphate aldolase